MWLRGSAICGLAAPITFIAGWLIGGLAQPDEYSMVDHDISDLGALTANSPWIYNQIGANLTGLLLCALTLGLWQTVGTRLSARIGVVAFAVFSVGTILDGLVRVDCRAIDGRDAIPLCENTGTSWHATAHAVESVISILAFFIAMFALSRAFKKSAPWHDLWVATLAAGIGALFALVVLSIPGAGLGERVASTILFAWIALVSYRLLRISGQWGKSASPALADT